MGNAKVWSNPARNRLYVSLSGSFSEDETYLFGDQIMTESKKLRKGFDTIADIEKAIPARQEDVDKIKQVQSFLKVHGLKKAVRVVGNSYMSNMQLNRMSKEVGYKGEIAQSVEAAEQMLNHRHI